MSSKIEVQMTSFFCMEKLEDIFSMKIINDKLEIINDKC